MSSRIRWGVLGTAKIAVEKVIPAMQTSAACDVAAIASRDLAKAQAAAKTLAIRKAYRSYDELLADPEVDAVYIPLPNHLHVPLTIQAAERGKHVLCEKPIALSSADVRRLIEVRDRTGRVVAALSISVPMIRWSEERRAELEQLAAKGAAELSERLGHRSAA